MFENRMKAQAVTLILNGNLHGENDVILAFNVSD